MQTSSTSYSFVDLFEQDVYRLQLFRTLHPDMTDITAEDIKMVTLKQVVTNHQYNDMAFLVKDRLMVFVEAQSTWSYNILLRILLYLADTIQGYLHDSGMDIHNTGLLHLPEPEFYVIFTGNDKVPDTISLKRDFFRNSDCKIDLEAHVFTAETDDIIGQYIIFCHVVDKQIKDKGRTREAAEEAIRLCQDRGVLAEYLKGREKEVADIMITLFDQEYATEQYAKSQREEGRQEGRQEGLQEGLQAGLQEGLQTGLQTGRQEGAICEAITLYHEEMKLNPTEIIRKIMDRFGLEKAEAEKYVEETLNLELV